MEDQGQVGFIKAIDKHRKAVKKKKDIVKITLSSGILSIEINNLTHLRLERETIKGFQSWVDRSEPDHPYYIEYYTLLNTIETAYYSRDTWEKILKKIKNLV